MPKNPGHRPRRNTPEQVEKAVDTMIAAFESSGDIKALHDVTLLQILGNISPRTLERYYDGTADKALFQDDDSGQDCYSDSNKGQGAKDTKRGYGDALKRLVAYRQMVCVEHIAAGGQVTGWIFLSKQPHWGGFRDVQRQETTGVQEFRVTISGPDGKPIRE